jgi:hypothetical protein
LVAVVGDPGAAVKPPFGDVAGGESRGFVFSGGKELALRSSRGLGVGVCSAGGEGIIPGLERVNTSRRIDVIASWNLLVCASKIWSPKRGDRQLQRDKTNYSVDRNFGPL